MYNANQISKWMNSWFRVVEKLHQDVILGFDFFRVLTHRLIGSVMVLNYKMFFFADGIPVYHNLKAEFCNFKEFTY